MIITNLTSLKYHAYVSDSIVSNVKFYLTVYGVSLKYGVTIITGPPIIITHPSSQLIIINMIITLDCEGTGKGTISYQWETSNINGGQWMNISDSNSTTLVVRNLEQSQQYRCVVSNEAGSNRSDIATVTVLSKRIHYTVYMNDI